MPELTPQQKKQLDSNIRSMLSQGATEDDVRRYASDFKSKYDTPAQVQQPVKQPQPVQQAAPFS
jgi:broad specificity phosphatase PhoE